MLRRGTGVVLAVALFGCAPDVDDLPPVAKAVRFEPPEPCFRPHEGPDPMRPRGVLSRPVSASACIAGKLARIMEPVPEMMRRDSLPLALTIGSDGRVTSVEFRDSCSGWRFSIDASTAGCIRAAVDTWRYEPEPETCPKILYNDREDVALKDPMPPAPIRLAHSGCGDIVS